MQAITASRAGPRPPQIILRNGTFFLAATITLTAADSGLAISAFPGEEPILSGGVALGALAWEPFSRPGPPPPNITGPTPGSLLAWNGGGCVDGPGASNPGVCGPLGQFAAVASCSAACLANASCTGCESWGDGEGQRGSVAPSFPPFADTYHTAAAGAEWATWCYARLDGMDSIQGADAGHLSGYKPKPGGVTSTWRASVAASGATLPFNQLYLSAADGGRRAIRARFPNANPETEQSPVGFTSGVGGGRAGGRGVGALNAPPLPRPPLQRAAGSRRLPSPPPTRRTWTACAPTTPSSPPSSGARAGR